MKGKTDSNTTIRELRDHYEKFTQDRNWGPYEIRDVILSIMIELGELAEHFQWDGGNGETNWAKKDKAEIRQELADVINYTMKLATVLDADITTEVLKKLEHHSKKYPVKGGLSYGNKNNA